MLCHHSLSLSTCLLTNLQRSLLEILAAEEGKVSMICETIHLDDALQRNISLGKQVLNLNNALLLHPTIWSIVELLLKHIVEMLDTETTDIGKLLDSLYTWCIVLDKRCK